MNFPGLLKEVRQLVRMNGWGSFLLAVSILLGVDKKRASSHHVDDAVKELDNQEEVKRGDIGSRSSAATV